MEDLVVKIGGNPSVTQTRTSAFGIASTWGSVPPGEGGDDYNKFFFQNTGYICGLTHFLKEE